MASLEIRGPGLSMPLPLLGARVTIGRQEDNSIALTGDARASRRHAVLECSDDRWTVRDLGSTNGTFVNNRQLSETVELKSGDTIRVGKTTMVFNGEAGADATVHSADQDTSQQLTKRELDVLTLLSAGRSDKQIAEQLYIGVTTVRKHLDNVRDKTGRRNRASLTRLAFELGLAGADDAVSR